MVKDRFRIDDPESYSEGGGKTYSYLINYLVGRFQRDGKFYVEKDPTSIVTTPHLMSEDEQKRIEKYLSEHNGGKDVAILSFSLYAPSP